MEMPKQLTDDEWRAIFRKILADTNTATRKAGELVSFYGYTCFCDWYKGKTRSTKVINLQIMIETFERISKSGPVV